MAIFRTLLGSTLLLISSFSTADVRIELSSDSIRQDETVQLHLKADGVDLQPPDLSVLDADFSIVDRHVQRSRSTINGRRRERIGLTLILLPKRTGSLKIPAISFGVESARPLELTVTAPAAQEALAYPDTGDFAMPGTGTPWAAPYLPPWQPYGPPPPLYADPSELAPGLLDLPIAPPSPEPNVPTEAKEDSHSTPATRTTTRGGTLHDPWFWVSVVLAFGLAASLLRHHRSHGSAPSEAETPAAPPVERPPIESPSIAAIRIAYQADNAVAARNALLAWGREVFPQNPPANLVRLAMRCDGPVRKQITLLEQASYSPTPLEWNAAPVWEWLQRSDSVSPELPPAHH